MTLTTECDNVCVTNGEKVMNKFWNPPQESSLARTFPDMAPQTEYVFQFDLFNVNGSRVIQEMIDRWGNGCRYYHVFADSVEEAWELIWIWQPQWKRACDKGEGGMTISVILPVQWARHGLYHRGIEAKPDDENVFWLGWKMGDVLGQQYASWVEGLKDHLSSSPRGFIQMNRYHAPLEKMSKEIRKMVYWSNDEWKSFREKSLTSST